MYKNYILTLFLLMIYVVHGQEYTLDKNKAEVYISEVYADAAEKMGLTSAESMRQIHNIIERITILVDTNTINTTEMLLSQFPVINLYNQEIKEDDIFVLQTFNPFKYKFNFYSKDIQYIRVDNTEYVIIINPYQ